MIYNCLTNQGIFEPAKFPWNFTENSPRQGYTHPGQEGGARGAFPAVYCSFYLHMNDSKASSVDRSTETSNLATPEAPQNGPSHIRYRANITHFHPHACTCVLVVFGWS